MNRKKGKPKSSGIYTLKVALRGNKGIWRRIEIGGDQTLDDLHEMIYQAFDREEEHLYSFYLPPPGSVGQARIRDALEFTHPYVLEDDPFDDGQRFSAAETTVDELKLRRGRKFDYLFDFGDSWWHEITVEGVGGTPEDVQYPRIVEKHGASPPQYPDPDYEIEISENP
jgi:hypothetical protein